MVPRDRRVGLLDAGCVEEVATAWAGDGLLAGAVLTEPGVVGEEVLVDGPYGDFMGADGAEDGFGHLLDRRVLPVHEESSLNRISLRGSIFFSVVHETILWN